LRAALQSPVDCSRLTPGQVRSTSAYWNCCGNRATTSNTISRFAPQLPSPNQHAAQIHGKPRGRRRENIPTKGVACAVLSASPERTDKACRNNSPWSLDNLFQTDVATDHSQPDRATARSEASHATIAVPKRKSDVGGNQEQWFYLLSLQRALKRSCNCVIAPGVRKAETVSKRTTTVPSGLVSVILLSADFHRPPQAETDINLGEVVAPSQC